MPSVSDILDTMDYGTAPESNTHVVAWLKEHAQGFGHFINGTPVDDRHGIQCQFGGQRDEGQRRPHQRCALEQPERVLVPGERVPPGHGARMQVGGRWVLG